VERARILVVDDDDGIRKSMKAILEDEGYNVDVAENGKEAIQKTQKKAYNLALLDIRLPDMEGVELLKLLKDSVPKIRKIIVTGYPSVQNAIAALNKGADAYLIKPVRLKKLLKTVKDQLKQQEDDKAYCEQKVAEFIDFRIEDIAVNHI
jgi:DNA-binding NtrC family response regulator